jgi:uncharacterized protein
MDYILLIIGFLLVIVGFIGCVLPVLPGLPFSWAGLLCLFFVKNIQFSWVLLAITGFLTLALTILDYIIPAQGTKRFGGTKYGIWGTNIGLVAGIFIPIPFAFIIMPFVGAFVGEMFFDAQDKKRALNAAFGSFLGFLAGTFMKVFFALILFGIFIWLFVKNWSVWF